MKISLHAFDRDGQGKSFIPWIKSYANPYNNVACHVLKTRSAGFSVPMRECRIKIYQRGENMTDDIPTFNHFLPRMVDEFEAISNTHLENYSDHAAFVYFIADTFETTDSGSFFYTDGPKDGGIDFYISSSPAYAVYQCKCPDLQVMQGKPGMQVHKFDQSALEELMAAVEMLRDRAGSYDVRTSVKRLRGDFQRDRVNDPESTGLTATLAVLGELTSTARKYYEAYRLSLAEEGIGLRLIEWQDIYRKLNALASPQDVDIVFDIHMEDKENDVLSHRDYCYVLAYAFDFYEAFRKHEWNLFDWNVRYQIPNSAINKRIVRSLQTRQGRKIFHHLNNGILITCTNYSGVNRQSDNRLTVNGAQIINGCQTVRAIFEAYEDLPPRKQALFRKEARVQVKIIQNTSPDFIAKLVVSTNDQNPMKPRNLKSNSSEQRRIQKDFRNVPDKWFYQRKDGEWKSLATTSSRVRWFRKSDYVVEREGRGRRKYRTLDNQKLAKAWYAFVGYSNAALTGGVHYFEEGTGGVYQRIFKSTPSEAFWSAFSDPSYAPDFNAYFEPGTPSVYQYLLAFGIAEYIDDTKISARANKAEAKKKGIVRGVLDGDADTGVVYSSTEEVNRFLNEDTEYNVNKMIAYMREVLVELYSFLLARKYASCDPVSCQKIVSLPHLAEYFRKEFDPDVLSPTQDGESLFGPTYAFIKDCVKQYYFANKEEIRAAPRLRSYLAKRTTITKLRRQLVERNAGTRDWDDPKWKLRGKTFVESLPEI